MAKGDLRPHWHLDKPLVHKVKFHKSPPRDKTGYVKFLLNSHKATMNYLMKTVGR